MWFCRTKELSPSDSGQLSPVGSSSNPSPPDDSGSPVEMSVESTTFLDPCMPGGRPVDSITRPPHNMAPVGVMNMQLPFTHQLPFANSVSGHHLSLFSDSGFVSSRQTKPPFDQPVTGNCNPIANIVRHLFDRIIADVSWCESCAKLRFLFCLLTYIVIC